MSFSASSVHAAATMALVDAMAGMMFFTTPPVSCHVTPCAAAASGQKQQGGFSSPLEGCDTLIGSKNRGVTLASKKLPSKLKGMDSSQRCISRVPLNCI